MKTIKLLLITALLLAGADTFAQNNSQRNQKNNSKNNVIHTVPRNNVKYKKPVTKVRSYHSLPGNTVVIKHKGSNVHFNAGRYYRYNAGRYTYVAPPVGIRINILPAGYIQFSLGRNAYIFCEGVYYRQVNKAYEVVNPPMNAVIPKLPGDAERIEINGQMYWECYGTIYQAVRTPQGRGYQVVGNIDW